MQGNFHVVIVGGGFSGIALAAHLLKRGDGRLGITLLEAGQRLGRGLAYGTPVDAHVLNTRADQMGLFADEPDHFVRWRARAGRPVAPGEFVARHDYGEYLENALKETLVLETMVRPASHLPHFAAETGTRVIGVVRSARGYSVALHDGRRIECDAVVLATGHEPPADPLAEWLEPDARRYVRNPWRSSCIRAISPLERVLLIGTGLTMVDVALALAQNGHRGGIDAVSRRGLLPRAHAEVPQSLPIDLRNKLYAALAHGDLRDMLRAVRGIARAAELRGISWEPVVDALRPLTPALWAALGVGERRVFVHRLKPFWDVHRHRVAPGPAGIVAELLKRGQLDVRAGRVRHAVEFGDCVAVELIDRGESRVRHETYGWIVNCTGPGPSMQSAQPLKRQMVADGLLAPDPLGLGYLTGPNGAATGARGSVPGLYLLGPACRARYLENTAVPELRRRADQLSSALLERGTRARRAGAVRLLKVIGGRRVPSPA